MIHAMFLALLGWARMAVNSVAPTQVPTHRPIVAHSRMDPKSIIDKMHAVCDSLGDKLASTNGGNLGDNDLEFACEDKDGVWYWIRWGNVK